MLHKMKVTPQQIKLVARLYREQKPTPPRRTHREGEAPLDKVTISEESQEIQTILSELKDIPDVREEKVAKLRAAIDQGAYEISGRAVAEKLLDRILRDDIFQEDV
ncbi:MAG: flagellar biosynthesis anti-sigma factor FlgM [Firmicutes bacterium]|nr:flagellar biosynthesis anti-sigma factor FlgM [Bacillota bacterium]